MPRSAPLSPVAIGQQPEVTPHTDASVPTQPLPTDTLSPSTAPASLPTPPSTNFDSANALLVAAAAHVDQRKWTCGPLWRVHCATKAKPRMELQVYDVFCMVFLDRPGAYYRIDQRARTNRGRCTASFVVDQLRTYHRLVCPRPARSDEVHLTNSQLSNWWLMPRHARTSFDARLAASTPPPAYDYSYLPFLRSFIPQSCSRDADSKHRFFNSLARYVPLLLSDSVELRRSPSLASSAFAYGVFARRRLPNSQGKRAVPGVRGEVVLINADEHAVLVQGGAAHSVLELDATGLSHLLAPGQTGRKRKRVTDGSKVAVVAGGVSFINHACKDHANVWTALWETDQDVGAAQWQVVSTARVVEAGEELYTQYADISVDVLNELPCSMCAAMR